jgi:Putative beta-barrel porin 2
VELLVSSRRGGAALAFALLAFAAAAAALESAQPGVRVSASVQVERDDNLFRLADGVAPSSVGLPGDTRSDTLTALALGTEAVIELSRQRLAGWAQARDLRLANYPDYGSRSNTLGAAWFWQLGNDFDGRLRGERDEQLTELRDFVGSRRNVLAVRNLQWDVNWRPRPDRRANLRLDRRRGDNSLAERRSSDYTIDGARFELTAQGRPGTDLLAGLRLTRGEYPNRTISPLAPVDNSYLQRDADFGFNWSPGGNSQLLTRLGYGWRRHRDVSARDFEGPVGRLELNWRATGLVLLQAAIWRDLNAVDDFDRLFAVSTRRSLLAQYEWSARLTSRLSWNERRLAYDGDPDNVLTQLVDPQPARRDRDETTRVELSWEILRDADAQLAYSESRRRSNRQGLDYQARTWSATARLRF